MASWHEIRGPPAAVTLTGMSVLRSLVDRMPPRVRHKLALGMHRRGVYRLGDYPFGAIDRNLMLERFDIDLVLDIGANVGGWARQLRERGYCGRIISVEPGSPQFALLAQSAASDSLWEAHHAGVGEVDGVQVFNVASNMVSSSFLAVTDRFTATHPDVKLSTQEEVEVWRLDRFAEQVAAGTGVWVKLDIEGYELRAIRGGREMLAKTRIVDVELATTRDYEREPLFFEVASALYDLGFELVSVGSAVTAPSGRTIRFDGLFGRPEVL
jgi:FkbM family methyltransferase